ncbi:hypothetical protein BS47DRAFT_1403221 [Hydnum rufescens UP504]|uniref:Uncharacterized protein n=1 Tax=Hydnum rufescens UP504 TaxID=1448309 RepID=A0A9P6ABH4_9AGAM|nr:hypothetical protein BS47DRAFT_1403221 [Hydnum rufescens UP504]
MSKDGQLVQADGLSLPHGDLDDGVHSFDLFNQEVSFPEEQQKARTKKWVEPYDAKELKGQMAEHPNCMYVEWPQQVPVNQPTMDLEHNV